MMSSLHSFSKIKYVLSSTGVQLLQDALHDIINEVFQTLDESYSSLFELELSTYYGSKRGNLAYVCQHDSPVRTLHSS